MSVFTMVVIYVCIVAFTVYIWKGIGEMNEAYDLSAARYIAKKKNDQEYDKTDDTIR